MSGGKSIELLDVPRIGPGYILVAHECIRADGTKTWEVKEIRLPGLRIDAECDGIEDFTAAAAAISGQPEFSSGALTIWAERADEDSWKINLVINLDLSHGIVTAVVSAEEFKKLDQKLDIPVIRGRLNTRRPDSENLNFGGAVVPQFSIGPKAVAESE